MGFDFTYFQPKGKIKYGFDILGFETDFTMIEAGALHRANGGVLILRAEDLVNHEHTWRYLKAALRDREIRIEEVKTEVLRKKQTLERLRSACDQAEQAFQSMLSGEQPDTQQQLEEVPEEAEVEAEDTEVASDAPQQGRKGRRQVGWLIRPLSIFDSALSSRRVRDEIAAIR